MRKSILRASAGLQALALMGAGTAASFIVAAPAAAQDYTSGAIIGSVTGNNGAPVAGATITLRSLAQGQVRTLVTSSSGTFSASGLTPGDYAISVAANGYQTYEDTLTVTAAQESRVLVGPLVSVTQSATVVVTGRRLRQTATGGTTGLNVDVTAVNKNLAIGHNITAVTLLAPTTARGVSGFRSPSGETVPSIGGSSVAENAYYINGLNITNPDTYVGSARVPFYFYKNVDVQTGGYAAEFGRATGGVINATTKSGTNEPFIALHLDWEPRKLSSTHPNIGDPAYPSSIGKLANSDNKQATIEAGGAIIPDHLFVYGLLQANRYKSTSASAASGTYYVNTNNDPFWGGKVDAYINPTQHLEFTIFDTRSNTKTTAYDFTPNSALNGGTVGASKGVENNALGGLNWVARYTGNVTDWLTLSGAYGVSKDRNNLLPSDPNAYYVVDYRASTGCQSGCVISAQPYGSYAIDSTRRRFYRGDADLRLTFAGQHHFRFGFDNEDLSEDKITALTGTNPVRYYYFDNYIRLLTERLGGHVSGTDTAFYAEDSWQTPLDGLTINFGIRDDIFKQYNLIGEQYANYKNNWGPRVAFSYTPPALDKWKFFGSYGRYFIPPAMNLGFRGKDLYFFDYFNYPTGYDSTTFPIDPTTGLPLANVGSSYFATRQACPAIPGGASNPGAPSNEGDTTCVIYGGGIQNPAIAKVVPGSKAEYEDEFILGTRYQATHLLSIGLQATYRTLHQGSEDTDFGPQLAQHFCGTANLYDSLNFTSADFAAAPDPTRCQFYTNNSTYMIWNPGASSVTVNDWYSALSGQTMPVNLTGLTFPTMKRTYKALVLDFNRADDGRWMAGGSVTWSKSKGNTEGTVKSDAGNGAQEDAGSTTDMDYVGLEDYAYGLLPNDHRWTFKFYGAYHLGRAFTIGANVLVQSPMHGSCEGIHPTDPIAANYLSNSFYCGDPSTLFTDEDGNQVYGSNIPAPRGTGWKSDWLKQVDLSFRYNIHFGPTDSRMLTLRADVFNVFNTHGVMQRYGENESDFADAGYYKDTLYLTPLNYQQPRYVRLGLDVMFGGSGPAPAPAPVIAPPPPPPPAAPATQTCPDGTVILATDACPVPPPPPPPPPPPAASGERGQ